MHDQCGHCGFVFERAQGYFVGAIYLNYVFTIALCLAAFLGLERWSDLSSTTVVTVCTVCSVALPLLFFRYSRSLWLSVEYLLNPDAG